MSQPDLVLLHPPSVYDFRQKTILYGPVSDLIPSSHVFEMYPIGFATIGEYLERAGYRVRIVNLAVRMLNDRKFDAEAMIARLKAPVFGIDLHWLVSAHGAIEVARIVKRRHPEAKVVVGGLSASYFFRDLMRYPEIDFVIRGDSAEEPLRRLMEYILGFSNMGRVGARSRSPDIRLPSFGMRPAEAGRFDLAGEMTLLPKTNAGEAAPPQVPASGGSAGGGKAPSPLRSDGALQNQLEDVPNLVRRDERGETRENPFSHVPADLDNFMADYYANTVRAAMRYRDLAGYTPFREWTRYPITAVPTCRGCNRNCVFCGGSAFAYRNVCGRDKTAFRTPQSVVRDVEQIQRFSRGPIFILGDLRQPGEGYAHEILNRLQETRGRNQFMLEFFSPAPADLLRRMGKACPGFCLEISPESHDPEVRKASGKFYSNQELEQTLSDALDAGCGRLDVFFMIGLPKQTPLSVMDTVEYCDALLTKFRADKRLALFIGPLAPFLDPGSLGFEQAERYGYRILFRTLDEYRQALLAPTWKHALNYETEWMTREQIVDTTYEAILRLNRVKAKHGTISMQLAQAGERRIEAARGMMREIDQIVAEGRDQDLTQLKTRVNEMNAVTVLEKHLLRLPVGLLKLRFLRCLWWWATGR